MKYRCLLLVGSALSCAALIFAQTVPSTLPLAAQEHRPAVPLASLRGEGLSWVFNLKGKTYAAQLTREQVAAGPEWTPSAALPLSLANAEEMARGELRKLVDDDSTWEVTELGLQRFLHETRTETLPLDLPGAQPVRSAQGKWYCLVRLMPKARSPAVILDSFVMLISFSGEAGRVAISR